MQTVGVKATSWSVCYLHEVEEEENCNHIPLMQQTTAFSLMVNCCQTDTGLPCRSLLDETAPHPFLKKEKKNKKTQHHSQNCTVSMCATSRAPELGCWTETVILGHFLFRVANDSSEALSSPCLLPQLSASLPKTSLYLSESSTSGGKSMKTAKGTTGHLSIILVMLCSPHWL